MPTPIGHGLLGAAVLAAIPLKQAKLPDWRTCLLGAFLAAAPDLDCLLDWLPFAPFAGRYWHHDFTHSLGFACFCGFWFAVIARGGGSLTRAALLFSTAMASHPLLDFFFTDSTGVKLFWPFSQEYVRLAVPSPTAFAWNRTSPLGHLVDVVQVSTLDFVIYGSLFLLVWLLRQLAWRSAWQGEGKI
ncbi:MAG: metal-dependent hydrolase [Acidobacteria bacterium]|nr:metal-dependent hydrolase [Acidobacteriota bacterium]MBI3427049.1 metal-dependent hydrolase [Acidobacteriota bacterium]